MSKRTKARYVLAAAIVPVFGLGIAQPAQAALRFWDRADNTAGAGATPTGTWDAAAANWNLNADGSGANAAWNTADTAVFSAGSDATGAFTVTVSGTQATVGFNVEEGIVSIAGGAIASGASPIVVSSGATLSTDSSLRVSTTAGSQLTLNGGTLRTTNGGANGTFFDQDTEIILGAGGGTFSYTVTNVLNIVQTGTRISGSGSLTKTGPGVLAVASVNTYTGPTIVNDGELRVRAASNILPTGTALTVSGPGILNLNNLNQAVASLSGDGTVGTGSGTLTVSGSASTTFSGVVKNVANGGAGGVTTTGGKLTKSGSGTLSLTGVNTYDGATTIGGGTLRAASATGQALANTSALIINTAASTFALGQSDQVNNPATVTLNGGKFDTGGFSEGSFDATSNAGAAGLGALTLSSTSTIDLGAGTSVLAFLASGAATWAGTAVLNVHNYSGTLDLGNGADRLYFGSDAAGLTSAQLAQVKFFSDAGTTPIGDGAKILDTGEVVPAAVPEPGSLAALGLGAIAFLGRRRRA